MNHNEQQHSHATGRSSTAPARTKACCICGLDQSAPWSWLACFKHEPMLSLEGDREAIARNGGFGERLFLGSVPALA